MGFFGHEAVIVRFPYQPRWNNYLNDESRDSRKVNEQYEVYRELIMKDFRLFLDSVIIEFRKLELEHKYGPHYN
jgi:hypothetical protein